MPLSLMGQSMRAVATARFCYSAALTPWTDAELEELFKVWMQVEMAAWKLQHSFPSAQFQLPAVHPCSSLTAMRGTGQGQAGL